MVICGYLINNKLKMKKLLLILLCLPMIGFGQQVYVPDDNFENYLEANGMGDGIALNDYIRPLNIYSVTSLNLANILIMDYTGLEGFGQLEEELTLDYLTEIPGNWNIPSLPNLKWLFDT